MFSCLPERLMCVSPNSGSFWACPQPSHPRPLLLNVPLIASPPSSSPPPACITSYPYPLLDLVHNTVASSSPPQTCHPESLFLQIQWHSNTRQGLPCKRIEAGGIPCSTKNGIPVLWGISSRWSAYNHRCVTLTESLPGSRSSSSCRYWCLLGELFSCPLREREKDLPSYRVIFSGHTRFTGHSR